MYLLDTDILITIFKRVASPTLVRKLAWVSPDQQSTSSITVGELVYGAHRAAGRTHLVLEQLEERLLRVLPVLAFDLAAARQYGQLRAELEREGMRLDDGDLRIAAIALSRGLTIVTGNVCRFERVPGLLVENWLEE